MRVADLSADYADYADRMQSVPEPGGTRAKPDDGETLMTISANSAKDRLGLGERLVGDRPSANVWISIRECCVLRTGAILEKVETQGNCHF